MIVLKNKSVNPKGMSPQLLLALIIAEQIYKKHVKDLVITSLNDGIHSDGSLHYEGNGVDLRTNFWSNEEAKIVADELRAALHDDYDVVLESNHIHLEYDPK